MNFTELRTEINSCIGLGFQQASSKLQDTIFNLRKADILELIIEIGTLVSGEKFSDKVLIVKHQ